MAESTRPTIKFKTEKHSFVLNEYLTGREKRSVKNALYAGKNMRLKGKGAESDDIPMEDIDASNDKAIELMVVTMDDTKETVLSRVLDLPSQEYDALMNKIDELTGESEDDAKKDNGSSNTKG